MRAHPLVIAGALSALFLCAACGTSSLQGQRGPAAPVHTYAGDGSDSAPAEAKASYSSSDEAAPSETARPSAPPSESSYEPVQGDSTKRRAEAEVKDRPGLGTRFGESRTSPVKRTTFERAGGSPFTTLTLLYNDTRGVQAQLRYRGGEELAPLYARTPDAGITVALLDESGRVLQGRSAGGRTYVVGQAGRRYSILVRNPTRCRLELVASVDGLDVIDGRPAALEKRGYVVDPYGSLVIEGFRTSDNDVAAFRFSSVRDSYAARTSGDRNVGAIGLAFFDEKGFEWTPEEIERRETANPFPSTSSYAQPPPPLSY